MFIEIYLNGVKSDFRFICTEKINKEEVTKHVELIMRHCKEMRFDLIDNSERIKDSYEWTNNTPIRDGGRNFLHLYDEGVKMEKDNDSIAIDISFFQRITETDIKCVDGVFGMFYSYDSLEDDGCFTGKINRGTLKMLMKCAKYLNVAAIKDSETDSILWKSPFLMD